jgi:hypothetical protein
MGEAAMAEDDLPARRVDEVVTVLMLPILDEVEGKRRRRLRDATADLRECIEVHGERAMSEDEARLLELERQFFDPQGAVARVAPAPVLLRVLPFYLQETRWQGADDVDRRVRMRLALRLARATARLPELHGFDVATALADVERAWKVANRRLRREQGQRALERLPPDARTRMEEFIAQVEARRAAEARESGEPG